MGLYFGGVKTLLIGLVVLACAVWVLFDSQRRGPQSSWAGGVRGGDPVHRVPVPTSTSATSWHLLTKAPAPSNRWVGLALQGGTGGATTFNAMRREALLARSRQK